MPILEVPLLFSTPATLPGIHRVVLIGFMGAGKSTTGQRLAKQLGWTFMDTDALVEQRHATTIAAIFAQHGESVFRQRESAALVRALGQKHVVIAVGGGAPEVLTNRLLLEQTAATTVIFLNASFPVLYDRCVLQEGAAERPVLQDPAAARQRFQDRTPAYQRCAHHILDTGALTSAETTEKLLTLLM